MSNAAAERLRWEMGVAYRIALLDEALTHERKATVERIRAAIEADDDRTDFVGYPASWYRQRVLRHILDAEAAR